MRQKEIQNLLQQFASETARKIGDQLEGIIWYGSTARGKSLERFRH